MVVRQKIKKIKAKQLAIAFLAIAGIFGALTLAQAAETPIHNEAPGTVITFSGKEWIVLEQMPNGETYIILLGKSVGKDGFYYYLPGEQRPPTGTPISEEDFFIFDPNERRGLGWELNHYFFDNLSQKELISDHSWDRIGVDRYGNNGTNFGNVTCKVGLLSYREYKKYSTFYDGDVLNDSELGSALSPFIWWTRTPYSEPNPTFPNCVWAVESGAGFVICGAITDHVYVCPTAYLKSGVLIDQNKCVVGEGPVSNPPTKPIGLSASAESPTSVRLTWQGNTEEDLAGYKIYRNNEEIANVGQNTTTYTDNTAVPGTTYTYEIVAYNTSGQTSERSNPATVTTPTGATLKEPGSIITWGGREWIILEHMPNDKTYLILKEPACQRVFDPDDTNLFDPTDPNNIGYYLNNTFYNSLSEKESISEHSWDRVAVDCYNNDSTIDRGDVTCKVGLLSYLEYKKYSSYYDGNILPSFYDYWWWTRTPYYAEGLSDSQVYHVLMYGALSTAIASETSHDMSVRPAIYLPSNLAMEEGPGSSLPTKPNGLSASAESPTSVRLTWQGNTEEDLAGYKIYRNNEEIANVGQNTTTYTDNTAVPGTTYTYEIVAYNTSGQTSERSNPATVTTPENPQQLQLSAMWKGDYIEVTWAPDQSYGGQMALWRQIENGPWMAIKSIKGAERNGFVLEDRNVAVGLNCQYEIRINGGITNFFKWSRVAESGWATGDRPLYAPGGLRATLGGSSATVAWNAVKGATSYIVQYTVDNQSWQTQEVSILNTSVPRKCRVRVRANGTYSPWSGVLIVQ